MRATKKNFTFKSLANSDLLFPKGDKPRDDLKNGGPILLACVLYKIVISAIATRLKKFFLTLSHLVKG